MAEEMTGIERLREAVAKLRYGGACTGAAFGKEAYECPEVGCAACRANQIEEVADQIEREQNDAIRALKRENDELEQELAAAKRDLTDEAREAVGRLRAMDCTVPFDVDDRDGTILWRISEAIGGHGVSYVETRDLIADLIEHGGEQYVDVAALREIARKLEERAEYGSFEAESAERIRKALKRAPEPDSDGGLTSAEFIEFSKAIQDGFARGFRDVERDAAADWVEAHGGLEAVRDRMEMLDEFRSDVAKKVGVETNEDRPITLYGDVFDELDKRLMPEGMEWPRDTEGCRVDFGDLLADDTDDHDARAVDSIKFVGSRAYLYDRYGCLITTIDAEFDERIVRPKPEVLGADGKPIEPGQTVYYHNSLNDNAFIVVETTPPGGYESVGIRLPFAPDGDKTWVDPQRLTHTPPDTQARISAGKVKEWAEYWGCELTDCHLCPSKIGEKKPRDYYGVLDCRVAQGMDIARREQELRARTGGAE